MRTRIGRHARTAVAAAAGIAALAPAAAAQRVAQLTPQVRSYVAVDAPVVALTNVTVVDGTGAAPRARQTVVLRDGAIAEVGPTASVRVRSRSASPASPARSASAVRKTPARKMHVTTARHPPTSDVGFIHDAMRSP